MKHTMLFFIMSFSSINVVDLSAQSFLKANGKKIVNENGNEIYLKGIGLGGWLVPEGYMLHTSGLANSPTEIRNKIEELIGAANADLFYQAYHENYVNRKDIQTIAGWGFNSIRIPFNYRLLSPKDQPGVYDENGFKVLDTLLSWCSDNKLYLILDMHCAPGGQNNLNISDYTGYPSLWEDKANQTRTVEIWEKIAERYKDEKWIAGYDLINETAWSLGSDNAALRNLYIQITQAIRSVDQNHIIFIEGNWFATDFNGLTPPWDSNMVYSFHKYWNSNTQNAIQYMVNIRDTYNVPLWLGETGENSNQWFIDCVELMKQNNIGWAWWPHKKIKSIAGPLSARVNSQYQQLLDYWNGNGSKPSVSFATNALISQAKNLHIDKCDFHPDVIDALMRQPGNYETLPYADNQIPGIIYADNYDIGREGYAYHDADYQNTGNNGTYNKGWSYRNDGVDIEVCQDIPSNGYDVGYIETGEWLQYTVNIANSGTYDLSFRVAAGQTGGKILFKLDGQDITGTIDITYTGGWQKWNTVNVPNVSMPAGKHIMRVYLGSGFNLNYFEFTENTVDIEDEKQMPAEYFLLQNYPNPFNPMTTISYSIAEESHVSLIIYDVLGRKVAELVNRDELPGSYNVRFNAEGLSGGVYYYRIQARNFTDQKKLIMLK